MLAEANGLKDEKMTKRRRGKHQPWPRDVVRIPGHFVGVFAPFFKISGAQKRFPAQDPPVWDHKFPFASLSEVQALLWQNPFGILRLCLAFYQKHNRVCRVALTPL